MKDTLQKMILISLCLMLGNISVMIRPISQKYELDILCLQYNLINNIKSGRDKENLATKTSILKSIERLFNKNLDLKKENINPCREDRGI